MSVLISVPVSAESLAKTKFSERLETHSLDIVDRKAVEEQGQAGAVQSAGNCSDPFQAFFVGEGDGVIDSSQKSEYEGSLAISQPLTLNEQWVVDGNLSEDRTVLRQDTMANNSYQPLLTPFQQDAAILADPSSVPGPYFFIAHRMNRSTSSRLVVGFEGTITQPICRPFTERGAESPTTQNVRAYFWEQDGTNWNGQFIPNSSVEPGDLDFYTSEALGVNNNRIIVGYSDLGLGTTRRAHAVSLTSGPLDFQQMTGIPGPDNVAYDINESNIVTGPFGDFLGSTSEISGFICKLNPSTLACNASTLLSPVQLNSLGLGLTRIYPRSIAGGDYTGGEDTFVVGRLQSSSFFAPPAADDCHEEIPYSLGFICKPDAAGQCDPNSAMQILYPVGWRSDIYNVNNSGVFAGFSETSSDGNMAGIIGVPNGTGWDEIDLNTLSVTHQQSGQPLQNDYHITRALDVNDSCDILVETHHNVTHERKVAILTNSPPEPSTSCYLDASVVDLTRTVQTLDLTIGIDPACEPGTCNITYQLSHVQTVNSQGPQKNKHDPSQAVVYRLTTSRW